MLHAECCEKGVHPWVPRRSSAPGPMAGSAEHANEVIMLCPSLAPAPSLQCGLCLSVQAGYPRNAANYRCHIWHNERSTRASVNEPLGERRGDAPFFISSESTPSRICIRCALKEKQGGGETTRLIVPAVYSISEHAGCVFSLF